MLLTDVVTNRLECDLDFSQTRQSQRSLFLSNFALILLISAPLIRADCDITAVNFIVRSCRCY